MVKFSHILSEKDWHNAALFGVTVILLGIIVATGNVLVERSQLTISDSSLAAAIVANADTNVSAYIAEDRLRLVYICPAGLSPTETLYGSDPYYYTSPVCLAGAHKGHFTLASGGYVVIEMMDNNSRYEGSTRNGIESEDLRSWSGSYRSGPGYDVIGGGDELDPTVTTGMKAVALSSSATSWPVPPDWNSSNNTIEVIGGGGGSVVTHDTQGRGGGGGGAYARITNLALTPGATVSYQIGLGATGGGGYGGDTWFNRLSGSATTCTIGQMSVCAKGGQSGYTTSSSGRLAGAGGSAAASIGTLRNSGGNGYPGDDAAGGGGGGAGGAQAAGSPGQDQLPVSPRGGGPGGDGNGGQAGGGQGGNSNQSGGTGTNLGANAGSGGGGGGVNNDSSTTARSGGLYGGGAGGSGEDSAGGTSGTGGRGGIVVSWEIEAIPVPLAVISAGAGNGVTRTIAMGDSIYVTANYYAQDSNVSGRDDDIILATAINGSDGVTSVDCSLVYPASTPAEDCWKRPDSMKRYTFSTTTPGTYTFSAQMKTVTYDSYNSYAEVTVIVECPENSSGANCACDDGYGWDSGLSQCVSCTATQHSEGGLCVNNTRSCGPSNSTGGSQTWDGDSWETCGGWTCVDPYVQQGESCVDSVPEITSVEADPSRVRNGQYTTISWVGTDLPPTCTLSSTPSLSGFPVTVNSLPGNGEYSAGPIVQTTVFTLVCETTSDQVTVGIVPVYREL